MELDDLKKAWQQDTKTPTQTPDIMQLIHQKSRGPIASLKQSFRRQMITVSVLLTVVMVTNGRQVESVPGYVLLVTYILFCLAVILGLHLNYRLTERIERMDQNVKANLENYVNQLQIRLKWQYNGARLVVLVLILLVEILPLYYHARMLDTWHSVSPLIRFSAYAVYMLFVYFISRRVKEKKFGQHLRHLKEVLAMIN
ncbi:hypothetical protein HRH25_21350 [Flavisolibacter sp. BT320]|nr:hypothetical protein [Flavisolibacter longurius]